MGTIIDCEEYKLSLQQAGTGCIVHCDVYKWSHTVLKKLRVHLQDIAIAFSGEVAVLAEKNDTHHKKFISKFNFIKEGTKLPSTCGKVYEVYVWA